MYGRKEAAKRTSNLLIKLSCSRSPNFPGATYSTGKETEVIKEGTKASKKTEKQEEKFHCTICSFLARETRATFTHVWEHMTYVVRKAYALTI